MNKKSLTRQRIKSKITAISNIWRRKNEQTVTDYLGSYTGTTVDGSAPVQDADDL